MQLKTTINLWVNEDAVLQPESPLEVVKVRGGYIAKCNGETVGKIQPRYTRFLDTDHGLKPVIMKIEGRNVTVGFYGADVGSIRGKNGMIELKDGQLTFTQFANQQTQTKSIEGVQASVETGEQLHERVTLTRVALFGIFALGLKKRAGGERYLVIDGKDFAWALEVDYKHANEAFKFATMLNNAVKELSSEEALPGSSPTEDSGGSFLDELERLAALKSSGMLDEDEFQIAKRKILGI
ncbi:SHOCT domain-containing protein [Collinsella sp. AGMB00827]|uniref:SHOCT domain-containing protein n=1 Tax=Collinsella ureilytica TaxID=2869515 RepID=A0ABS7MHC2_9ACTN|nr:SHOCT domain-containing protein [Collinsella urealyticum]MBY4796767.1 SHOCT domain-containing protein [Collinsella urealyticum]